MRRAGALLVLLSAGLAAGYPVEVLRDNGPSANRIDIAILGDGYTAAEQTKLTQDATTLANQLFATRPWSDFQALFNVKLVKVVSNQSGADQGTAGGLRDTALGAAFFCSNIERLLCVDVATVLQVAAADVPEYDLVLVVVNDAKYGGSGGTVAVASTNAYSGQVVIHELGHTLGHLADEYESAYPGYPACGAECSEANATPNATASIKWHAWVDAGTPLPTPAGASGVGAFEGCRYQSTGLYRPTSNSCMMRALGPDYCDVCRERMVQAFFERVSTIDALTPDAGPFNACGSTFSVTTPAIGGLLYAWQVNDGGVVDGGPTFSTGLPAGSQVSVQVTVREATTLVRSDPGSALVDAEVRGASVVGGCAPGVCDVSASCQADGTCLPAHADAGVPCGASRCAEGVVTGGHCDGLGGCATGTFSCGPWACDDAGLRCRSACADDTGCADGGACVTGVCVVPGVDAGLRGDAGTVDAGEGGAPSGPPEPVLGGCGCTSGSSGALAVATLAWLWCGRRRVTSRAARS